MRDADDPDFGEDFNADAQLVLALTKLSRLHFMLMHQVQERQRLYPGQPQLLSYLLQEQRAGRPMPSQRELARHLCIRPATLTVTLQRMEAAGMVRRVADAQDARIQRVSLTDKGEAVIHDFHQDFQEASTRLLQELPADRKRQLLADIAGLNQFLARKLPHHHTHGRTSIR